MHISQHAPSLSYLTITTHPQEPGKLLLRDESTSIRIKQGPRLLELTDLLPADCVQPAAPLVHVREALKNERHEKRHENVHADDVPRNEQSPGPPSTATIASVPVLQRRLRRAEGRHHGRKVFHQVIPSLTAAGAKKQDQSPRDVAEVHIAALIFPKLGETKDLVHGNGERQEEYKPRGNQVSDRGETSRRRLEKLIQLVVARYKQESD